MHLFHTLTLVLSTLVPVPIQATETTKMSVPVIVYNREHEVKYEDSILSPITLYHCIVEMDVLYPEIVWRQAMHETGGLRSRNCKRNNNLFGMKHSSRRRTTSLGNRGAYAAYAHWSESVRDYKYWQDLKPPKGDYYAYLRARRYAQDPSYALKLRRISLPPGVH